MDVLCIVLCKPSNCLPGYVFDCKRKTLKKAENNKTKAYNCHINSITSNWHEIFFALFIMKCDVTGSLKSWPGNY